MDKRHYTVVTAPFGNIYITVNDTAVIHIGIVKPALGEALRCDDIPIAASSAAVIRDYLAGKNHAAQVTYDTAFSPFQSMIFEHVCRIPYGDCVSCEEIAGAIGKPQSVKAVKTVCLSNPLWIVIPTHRVLLSKNCPSHNKPLCAAETLRRMEKRYLCTP